MRARKIIVWSTCRAHYHLAPLVDVWRVDVLARKEYKTYTYTYTYTIQYIHTRRIEHIYINNIYLNQFDKWISVIEALLLFNRVQRLGYKKVDFNCKNLTIRAHNDNACINLLCLSLPVTFWIVFNFAGGQLGPNLPRLDAFLRIEHVASYINLTFKSRSPTG